MKTNNTITNVDGFPNATIYEENGLGGGHLPLHRLDDRRGR